MILRQQWKGTIMSESTITARAALDPQRRQGAQRSSGTRTEPRRIPSDAARDAERANGRGGRPEIARKATRELHPLIVKAMIGLTACYVAAAWGVAGKLDADFTLFVVTAFLAAVATLSWIARRVWRASYDPDPRERPAGRTEFFADWAGREFEAGPGGVTGGQAVIQILLPIAAVALGMVALVVVTTITGGAG